MASEIKLTPPKVVKISPLSFPSVEEPSTSVTPTVPSSIPSIEPPKKKISIPRLLAEMGIDVLFMAGGAVLGQEWAEPLLGARLAENAVALARAMRIARITGETAGLAVSSIIQRKEKPEEAIKGAIEAQAVGLAISPVVRVVGKGMLAIPGMETAKKKVADKATQFVSRMFYGGQLPLEDVKFVQERIVPLLGRANHVRRQADIELKELSKNPKDFLELIDIAEEQIKANPFIVDKPYEALMALEDVRTMPIEPESAGFQMVFELAKHPKIEPEAKAILNKYPVLSKLHSFYKDTTEDYYKIIADKLSPEFYEALDKETSELRQRIANKIETLNNLTSGLMRGEFVTSDVWKKELKDTEQLIGELAGLREEKLLANREDINKIINGLKTTVNQLKRVRISELKETVKVKDDILKVAYDIENVLVKLPENEVLTPVVDILKDISQKIPKVKTEEELSEVKRGLKEAISFINYHYKKTFGKEVEAIGDELIRISKDISKISLVKQGLLKQQIKDLTLKKADEIRGLLAKIIPYDARPILELRHQMYYIRTGLPAKISRGIEEPTSVSSEAQLEGIWNMLASQGFHQEDIETLRHLKTRRYPFLLTKYTDELKKGLMPIYARGRTFSDNVAHTYIMPQALREMKNILDEFYTKNRTIEHIDLRYKPNPIWHLPYVAKSREDLIATTARLNNMPLREAESFISGHSNLFRTIPEELGGYYLHKDFYEFLAHSFRPLLSGRVNIFDISDKGLWGGLSKVNTLLKRVQVLFGLIHFKSLTTAAYGIGRGKELKTAWESVLKGDEWFKDHIVPMEKDVNDLIRKYNIKTTFYLSSYDDIREQIQRFIGEKTLAGKIAYYVDKVGFLKLAAGFDKLLWDRLFYTVKCASARNILRELEEGKITKEVAENFLNKLGAVFGGNYEWLFMKPQAREFIRLLLFAPDWYLTLTRHLTGSIEGHPFFADFFRRIFLLHYLIANEVSYHLTGKTTYENFQETKDWRDLFNIPLVSIDPKTGRYKRTQINLLGFEIEGMELVGVLPFYDFLYEYFTTNKSVKEAAKDATGKWAKYFAGKTSPMAGSTIDTYNSFRRGDVTGMLYASPLPIFLSIGNTILNRNVTFNEAGEKVPGSLLMALYSTGMKFRAISSLSEDMQLQLRRKVDREEATRILNNYWNTINAVTEKVRAVPTKMPLKSDDPKRWFEAAMMSAIAKEIDKNRMSDIKDFENGKIGYYDLARKVIEDFQGTALSYYPLFPKYLDKALRLKIGEKEREYRREYAGEEVTE